LAAYRKLLAEAFLRLGSRPKITGRTWGTADSARRILRVRKPIEEWSSPPDRGSTVFRGRSDPVDAPFVVFDFFEIFEIFEFLPPLIYVKDNFQKVRLFRSKMLLQGTFQKVRLVFGRKFSGDDEDWRI
jgi:hypothetical protein